MAYVVKPKPTETRPGTECCRGAALGGANGLLLALMAGAGPPTLLIGAASGCAVGALIALLIWSGTGAVAEDPVLPPRDDT